MLNFDKKGPGLIAPQLYVCDFSRKICFILLTDQILLS